MDNVVLVAFIVLACSCQPKGYEGEPVATFSVVESLDKNTCGLQAFNAPDPISYNVEIRRDGEVGYWRMSSRGAVTGTLDSNDHFRFRVQALRAIPINTQNQIDPTVSQQGSCTLEQVDTLSGDLTRSDVMVDDAAMRDAGTTTQKGEPKSLKGSHVISVSPTNGPNCAPALATHGGVFIALPCEVSYTMHGSARGPIP